MCLGVPGKVVSIEGNRAMVDMGGIVYEAGTHLVDDLKTGDYVILHAGYILEKLDEEDAAETLALFDELRQGGAV